MMKKVHEVIALMDELDEHNIKYVHERHTIGLCPWCDFIRVEAISKEFIRRLNVCSEEIRDLYMWSLGTSLSDTKMNRNLLMKRWNLFVKRMYHCEDWSPLFRVVEVGRRGFLHIHVICHKFVDHRVVLETWRSLTREKSNVHVSGHKGSLNPLRLARYLMKYLSKESSSYRWLGSFYGLGSRSRRLRSRSQGDYLYAGTTCYEFTTEGYEVVDDQRKL